MIDCVGYRSFSPFTALPVTPATVTALPAIVSAKNLPLISDST